MSLRWRLALVLAVVVAGTVALASTVAYLAAQRELDEGVDRALASEAAAVRLTPPRRTVAAPPLPSNVQVVAEDGTIQHVATPELPVGRLEREVAAGERPAAIRTVDVDGHPVRLLTVPRGPVAVQVARDLTELDQTLARLRNRLLLATVVGTAAAALVGWLIASRFTGPIRRLTVASRQLADQRDGLEPIPVDRNDEVGELAASFNAMTAALETSRRQQHQLVMDASHELRTPLTTLRTNIELLRRAPDLPPADRRAALDTATLELEELSALVAELVDLATDQRVDDAAVEEVALVDVVRPAVDRARRRTGRTIHIAIDHPATVRGVPARLARAITNLLDNADKFSPPGAPVEVVVSGSAVVVVDHGPGVAAADRSRVFDRFYRSDAARTLPGSGLGLSIVAQVAADHGGEVTVADTPDGGATFTLSLPPTP